MTLNRYCGWLNLFKPPGISSASLVGTIRRILDSAFGKNSHKVGHTGTLDPLASGVLPMAIGKATRLIEYLSSDYKEYSFTIQFGKRTNTGDLEGSIIEENSRVPSLPELRPVIDFFLGKVMQTPPSFSAIKVNGKRAYAIARENKQVTLMERQIEIKSLNLLDYDLHKKEASYATLCSSGTYIRSLAEDIARKLGTCGVVSNLVRTKSGDFDLFNSFDIFSVNCENQLEELLKRLLPLDFILSRMEKVVLSAGQRIDASYGLPLSNVLCKEGLFAAYNEKLLVGIGMKEPDGTIKIRKVFI
jgi:tRNA pseudouridine55 synthase